MRALYTTDRSPRRGWGEPPSSSAARPHGSATKSRPAVATTATPPSTSLAHHGSSSSSAAARRLMRARQQQQQSASTTTTAAATSSSRRRNMAFLKYGNDDRDGHSPTNHPSPLSVQSRQEHARQIVLRLSGEDHPHHDNSHPPHQGRSDAHDGFADFANFAAAAATTPAEDSFVADWPSEFDHHPAPNPAWADAPASSRPTHHGAAPVASSATAADAATASTVMTTTPTRRRHTAASTSSPATGAAARRRMRQQMRAGETAAGGATTALSPPPSPYQGASGTPPPTTTATLSSNMRQSSSHRRLGDHVQQPQSSSSHHSRTSYSNRSLSGRSTASSTEDGSTNTDIFDHRSTVGAGFTFDAFGLDASQMNAQFNQAIQDLAGSHPDLSFFRQDNDDDFANGRWNQQASPAPSRASTPPIPEDQHAHNDDDFVDGFRVTKQLTPGSPPQMLPPPHYPPSPSERSSLTSDSNHHPYPHSTPEAAPRRRVVRTHLDTSTTPTTTPMDPAPRGRRVPALPDLGPRHRQPPQHHHHDHSQVEFVGEDNEPPEEDPRRIVLDASVTAAAASLYHKKSSTDTATTADSSATTYTTQIPYEEKKEEEERGRKVATTTTSPTQRSPSLTRQSLASHQAHLHRTTSPNGSSPLQPQQQQQHYYQNGSSRTSPQNRSLHQPSYPRSEGGAMVQSSHVNSVMDRIKAQEEASQAHDAKSETGAAPYQVKLRKTGLLQRPAEDDAESPVKRTFQKPLSPPTLAAGASRESVYSPASQSSGSRPDYPTATNASPVKKMTYRERRELELQKEREAAAQQQQQEDAHESPPKDVARLIRDRIAANKKALSPQSVEALSPNSEAKDTVTSLPATTHPAVPTSSSSSHRKYAMDTPGKVSVPSAIKDRFQRQTSEGTENSNDLSIESGDADKNLGGGGGGAVKPSAAVSHLLMLRQIQTKKEPQEDDDDDDLSPEKRHQLLISVGSGDNEEHRKSQTPKATKMMLNAFLAGRSSMADGTEGSSAGPAPASSDAGSSSAFPALKDDPKYQKYFKMLKLGMPKEQVQHAMTRDGEDPSILDQDPNKPAGVPLKDDPTYQKYFKMLRVGMPMEAVKHAMVRDGLDCSVMDQDHNLPVNRMSKKEEEEPKERDSHRRARLHWKTLRKVTSNSLWARLDKEIDMGQIEIDEREFQELFQAEHDEVKVAKTTTAASTKGSTVRVIDSKRANNGGIILARLKMSHDDMADAVDRINEHALTAEQIEHIIEYLPTKDERKALESYMLEGGHDAAEKFEGLCECEKFMVSMMTVKHAKRKVRALLFKLQFEKCLDDILKDTLAIESACDNLTNSVRLRQLLGIILTFGNRLNTAGNKKRRAGAFTLDSLLKLNQAKAFDRKTTFLNYIVLIVQRNNEILLNFKDDLPDVFKADKVFWDQCLSDLEEVENQLENVRKIALYQARQAHFRFRRRKKQDDDDDESLGEDDMNLSLEEEVEALRSTPVGMFTLSAIKYVSSLRDKVEETKRKFHQLLEYFGEEDKSMQPHDLFTTMVKFCRDFDKAKEEVFALEKKKQREERKRQVGRPPTHSPAPPAEKKRQPMLKASSHQPNFSDVMRTSDSQQRRPPARTAPDYTSAGHSNHVSPRHSNHASPQQQLQNHASQYTYERSHSSPLESQHPNRAYSRSSSMPDHRTSPQQAEMRYAAADCRPGDDDYAVSSTVESYTTRSSSVGSPQSAAARLKAKARMHHRSSPPSSQERHSGDDYYEAQAARQASPRAHNQPPSPVYSPSNRSTDSGRSPRSSFRQKHRAELRERIRQANSRD